MHSNYSFGGPIDASRPTDRDALLKPDLEQFRQWVQKPIRLVPEESLHLLMQAVGENSGGSQAARSFLYWLVGEPDPTGFKGQGALELRRMDASLQKAAVDVFEWWIGPTASDEPLLQVLRMLKEWEDWQKRSKLSNRRK